MIETPKRYRGLRVQLMLALGLLCALVIVIAVVALLGLSQVRSAALLAQTDNQTSILANDVALQALLCRRYEKDFFLNAGSLEAQDAPLQAWHSASFELGGAIKAFAEAASTDADRTIAAGWLEAWREYVRTFGSIEIAVNQGVVNDSQTAVARFNSAQANIQALTDQALKIANQKTRNVETAYTSLGASSNQAIVRVLVSSLVVLTVAMLIVLLFPRRLLRPLLALQQAALRMRNGDFAARVGIEREDELGVLAHSFDAMAARIAASTAELEQQNAEARAARSIAEDAHQQISTQLAMISEQRTLLAEINTPVLPLTRSALVMPLVGALDAQRMLQAQERALQMVEHAHARYLLLDITGVPVVDTLVGQGLISLVAAARLLGCTVFMVGVRPDVAQTIVSLGLDLSSVTTFSTLQNGIDQILQLARQN